MITLKDEGHSPSSSRVLVAVGGIYTAQSLIGGLTFQGLPTVMRANGADLDRIGLVSLAMLPWALKFLWAPLVERYRLPAGRRGRRSRTVILVGEAVVVALLLCLAFADVAGFGSILGLLVAMALVSATLDIACDGFVIEQLPSQKRGWGNVAQVGGGYLGLVFGSGLFVIAASLYGWQASACVLAVLVTLMSLPFVFLKEPPRPPALAGTHHRPGLGHAFRQPAILRGIAMTMLFEAGGRLVQSLSGPFMIDSGVPLGWIGVLNGLGGVAAGLAGTVIGGLLVRHCGASKAVFVAIALQCVVLATLMLVVQAGVSVRSVLIAIVIVQAMVMAIGFVSLYSMLMGLASPLQAGVDFTIFQCASALAAATFGFGGGFLAQSLGYVICFTTAFAMALLALFVVPLISRSLPSAQGATA